MQAGVPDKVEKGEFNPANQREDIDRVEQAILTVLDKLGYPEAARFAVRLALEEALVNAFQHGHRGLPPSVPVNVQFEITKDQVILRVTDKGPGFKPEVVPDPTTEDNIELPSGRGLMLIRAFMASVVHDEGGRRLTMVYRAPAGTAA